ncbi:MAG: prephenate dehydrogenase/arogenate dehydrogenase family protein, partial [Verrucomicrobia bacterium]|nr:prephenate dehydrogenase/arogenate dehydrogenase family protein [Verrucomicrobiota bacterium]
MALPSWKPHTQPIVPVSARRDRHPELPRGRSASRGRPIGRPPPRNDFLPRPAQGYHSPLDRRAGFCVPAGVAAPAQLTILAPGLLGGSVARAAREQGAARRIVIWARRPETRLALRSQPWCDAVADTPAEAVREASLVVVAAPVDRIVALVRQIAPALPPGAIVTDVGSVKAEIVRFGHAAL